MKKILGVKPRLFRPPYGNYNDESLRVLSNRGYSSELPLPALYLQPVLIILANLDSCYMVHGLWRFARQIGVVL